MINIRERFSSAGAVAWYLGEDRTEMERNRRYQPTRTPCAIYSNGDEYLAATSSNKKPRESNDNRFGYWQWEMASSDHPYGWVIWRALPEQDTQGDQP